MGDVSQLDTSNISRRTFLATAISFLAYSELSNEHLPKKIERRVAEDFTAVGIQKAIDSLPISGGVVFLPPGKYLCDQPVVIDRDHIQIIGVPGETYLRLADQAKCPLMIVGTTEPFPSRVVSDVEISGLVLDGNRLNQGQYCECWGGECDQPSIPTSYIRNNSLTIRTAKDIRVFDVIACNSLSGGIVLEKDCRKVWLNKIESYGHYFDGVAACETRECLFEKMYIHDNPGAALSADHGFNNNIIRDSKFISVTQNDHGVWMRDSHRNKFYNLLIEGANRDAIFLGQNDGLNPKTGCRDNHFENITVIACGGPPILINEPDVSTGNQIIGLCAKDSYGGQEVRYGSYELSLK